MLKSLILLMFVLFGLNANAQFVFQGTSPIIETLDLSVGNTWTKSLIFKNNGTSTTTFISTLSGPDASKFKISINRCATTATAKGKTCQVTIESARRLAKKLDPYVIGYDAVAINLTVTDSTAPPVSNEAPPPVSAFSFIPDSVPLVEFSPGELNKSITLTVKNNGEQSEQPSVRIDSVGSLNLTYLINRCTTSVTVGKTCSVQLRINNPPDSNVQSKLVKIFVGEVEKDSILITASQSNLCVANSKKTCSVQNAQVASQTCSSDGKSYSECLPESCFNGFFLSNEQCSSIVYVPTYSSYDPIIPQSQNSCDGTVISNRTIVECRQQHDNAIVSNSLCSDDFSQIVSKSPPGNKDVTILNGKEVYSCLEGSVIQSYEDRVCNENFYNDLIMCAPIQYEATYTAYNPEIPTNLLACDGEVTSTRSVTECRRTYDNTIVANSFCAGGQVEIVTQSPQGNKSIEISNGSEIHSCPVGSIVKTFISRTCNEGYHDDLISSCVENTYVATYSDYNPLIPQNQNSCDGTIISTRGILDCRSSHDNTIVSNSLCSDPSPQIVSQSPQGNKTVQISNGEETYSCDLGSSDQTFVSRNCNIGYHDDLISACIENTYVPTYSEYSPLIPINQEPCDGTVISNRTVVECRTGHDNSLVDNSFCGTDLLSQVISQSAAGNKNFPISNGYETFYCEEGSTSVSFVSRTCSSGFTNNGTSCVSSGGDALSLNMNGTTGSAITTQGIYFWGNNAGGQYGNNNKVSSKVPISVNLAGALTGKTIKSLSLGNGFSCAIGSDDLIYCWGTNGANGVLGNNSITESLVPVAVDSTGALAGKTIKSISAGNQHICVIASDDLAYCWGNNADGQLGNNSQTLSKVPVAVNMSGVLAGKTIKRISVSISGNATCAIASDDQVYCWGLNNIGQLGNGTMGGRSLVPVAVVTSGVLSGKSIKFLASGQDSSCVIASDDKVYCWGRGDNGRLGNNTTTSTASPVAVEMNGVLSGKTAVAIAHQSSAVCIIASDNLPYCWGKGNVGSLGNGASVQSLVPVAVDTNGLLSGKTVSKITSGLASTCVLANDNKIYCWGSNFNSALGNNLAADSNVPVEVSSFP